MIYYDLTLNQWISRPGAKTPPTITPVVTVGANHIFSVHFFRDMVPQTVGASSWALELKHAGDYNGAAIVTDSTATQGGLGEIHFNIDLTDADPFAGSATPNADTIPAAIQISWTDQDGSNRETVPLAVVIQNTYLRQ